MAANDQINLVLKLITDGNYKQALSELDSLEKETKQLETASKKGSESQKQASKEQVSSLEKIRTALKEVELAQKLAFEAGNPEDQAAGLQLLAEAERKLAATVKETGNAEDTLNKKKLSDIRQLQQQLSLLTQKQKELQQAVKQGGTGKQAELSSVNAQVGALQAKITALRSGQQQLGQSTQQTVSLFNQTITSAEGLSNKFQNLTSLSPGLGQGLSTVGSQLVNIAKAGGPAALIIAGITTALTLASGAAIKAAEDTAFFAKTQLAIQRSTGASASFIGSLTSIIKSYGGEIQNVQELLLQVGSVVNTAVANPVGEAAKRFEKLGISATDAAGRAKSIEQVLREIDKIASQTALTTEQLTIISGIFGEEASKQFLDQVGNFAKIEERLKSTGAILSDELTKLANEYNQAGQLIQAQTDGLTFAIGGELLPFLIDIKKAASEAIAAIDPNDLDGIKAVVGDIGGLLKTLGTTGVDAASATINLVGNLATGITALLNPLDTARLILGIYPENTNKANISTEKLVKTFVSGTFAADELSKKIQQLAEDQKFLGDITQVVADSQILAIQSKIRQGLIDETKAAEEINRLEKRKAEQKTGFEQQKLNTVLKSVSEEAKRREEAAKQEDKVLESLTARRQKAADELVKIREEAFRREVALQADADKSDRGKQELEKAKEQNQVLISLAQQRFNQLDRAEKDAKAKSEKAAKSLADFRLATNLNLVVGEKKLSDDILKLRSDLQQATTELEKNRLDNQKRTEEEIKRLEQSIVDARAKTIEDINKAEALALEEAQALQKAGLLSKVQLEQEFIAIKLRFDKERLLAENNAVIQINNLTGASEETKTKLRQEASVRRQSIDKQEADQSVKLAQDAANARKALSDAESAQRQAEINKQKAQIQELTSEKLKQIAQQELEKTVLLDLIESAKSKIQSEKDNLEILKKQGATKEELLLAENKIKQAISEETVARANLAAKERDFIEERKKANADDKKTLDDKLAAARAVQDARQAEIKATDDASKAFLKGLEQVQDKLNQVAEFFKVTFDPKNFDLSGLQDAESQLEKFKGILEETNKELLSGFGSLSPLLKAQKIIIEESIIELENRIGEAKRKLAIENQRKANEAELAERRKGAEQALDIVKDFEEEASQIREDSFEKRRDLKQQIIDNAVDGEREITDLIRENQRELDEFDQQQKDRQLERADQQHQNLLEKEADFQASLANQKSKAAEEQLDKERDAILKRADLEAQIADLIAQKKGATPGEIEKIEAKIKELQGQIKGVDEAEKSRTEREKKKQDEITKAQQSASERVKNAKSADEVAQIQKELEIQIDGINEKFANEEKFEADLAKLKGKASEETIEALRKNFAAQQALVDKKVNDTIAAEQRQADLAEQARKKAADKEKADIEKRRQELIDAQNQELADRRKAIEEKQKQLEEALKKERQEYKEHIDELRTKTAESLAEIAKSFTDGGSAAEKFFVDFAKNAGLTGKAIDDILKKLRQFKSEVANNDQQVNNASNTNPSSNPSNPSNPSNNPFSSPTGNDPSTGNISFVQQSPNQGNPSANQQGNNNQSVSNSGSNPVTPSNISANSGIAPSSNQQNQNSTSQQAAPAQGSGNIDSTVPSEIATPEDYKAKMLKIQANALKAAGIDPNKTYTRATNPLLNPQTRNAAFAALDKATNVMQKTCQKFVSSYLTEGYTNFASSINYTLLYSEEPKKDKGQKLEYSFKRSIPRFTEFLDKQIAEMKRIKDQLEPQEPSKFDDDLGATVTPASPGTNPGDVNAPSNPNNPSNPGGGRGNNPGPRGPNTNNPKTPETPGLSDKEKAFFAGRDKDAENGEGEGASKKGFVRVAPDAAVGGGNAGNAGNAGTNQAGQSQNQSQNPFGSNEDPNDTSNAGFDDAGEGQGQGQGQGQTINQTNNSSITNNYYLSGILTDKKTQDEIMSLMQKREEQVQQEMQQKLRNLAGPNLLR